MLSLQMCNGFGASSMGLQIALCPFHVAFLKATEPPRRRLLCKDNQQQPRVFLLGPPTQH